MTPGVPSLQNRPDPHFKVHHIEPEGSQGPGRVMERVLNRCRGSFRRCRCRGTQRSLGPFRGSHLATWGTAHRSWNLGAHSLPFCPHALRDRYRLTLCMGTHPGSDPPWPKPSQKTLPGPSARLRARAAAPRSREPGPCFPVPARAHQASFTYPLCGSQGAGRTRPPWLGRRENFSALWGATGEDCALGKPILISGSWHGGRK